MDERAAADGANTAGVLLEAQKPLPRKTVLLDAQEALKDVKVGVKVSKLWEPFLAPGAIKLVVLDRLPVIALEKSWWILASLNLFELSATLRTLLLKDC